jgi:Carboxypeptidase regulatory-like domain
LPGVTVEASAEDGRVLATAVTDERGLYFFTALPAGSMRITFALEGFSPAAVTLALELDSEARLDQHLAVAPVAETVDVVGRAPVDPPPPPPLPSPPSVIPVPIHDRESVCGPAKAAQESGSFGLIESHRYDGDRVLYSKDDQVMIDGGIENGLAPGQNLAVRRYYRVPAGNGATLMGEHTAGLLQIVAAGERQATGVVVYACDELRKGDFLAAFNPEPARAPDPAGIPAFDEAVRILFADAGQMLGVPRRLMVIDGGSDAGIHVGQRLTLFRRADQGRARRSRTPSIIGNAVVVATRSDSATIRVERATDAIAFGDWAAPEHSTTDGASVASSLTGQR